LLIFEKLTINCYIHSIIIVLIDCILAVIPNGEETSLAEDECLKNSSAVEEQLVVSFCFIHSYCISSTVVSCTCLTAMFNFLSLISILCMFFVV